MNGRAGVRRRSVALLLVSAVLGCDGSTPGRDEGAADPGSRPWPDSVRSVVSGLRESDQRIRQELVAVLQAGPEPDTVALRRLAARQDSVDRANTARLKAVIRQFGWPSRPRAGAEATGAAFLVVQHATHDLPFQKEYLAFLRAEHREGRASGEAVALLTDRTRQAEGELQLYGTQARLADGRVVLDPIEDSAGVDERRAELGLVPLSEYVDSLERAYGREE